MYLPTLAEDGFWDMVKSPEALPFLFIEEALIAYEKNKQPSGG